MRSFFLLLLLSAPLSGQIQGPESVGPGELVVLHVESEGSTQWEAVPGDVVFVETAAGGVAFSSGCTKQTIVFRCYVINWDAKEFRVDKIHIDVDLPGPDDPPDDPLEGIAKAAYDAFSSTSEGLRSKCAAMAANFDEVSSRGAALSDWTGAKIMEEANSKNSALLKSASLWEEANPVYRSMLLDIIQGEGLDILKKDDVIRLCQEIAVGLREI